jgi:hypothetical protein
MFPSTLPCRASSVVVACRLCVLVAVVTTRAAGMGARQPPAGSVTAPSAPDQTPRRSAAEPAEYVGQETCLA